MTDDLRVGAACVNITPDYDVHLTGFASRTGPSDGVLDHIHARAAVFESGGPPVVIVSLDVMDLTRADADRLRQVAAGQAGTLADRVCIACTHTHSAPAAYPLKECGERSQRFVDDLVENVRGVVREGSGRLAPARLAAATTELRLGLNRRGHGGRIDAEDDTLRGLVATDRTGRCICAILNYACHAVCLGGGNLKISGDWPGIACSQLEGLLGSGAVVMFMQGCCGDINPVPGLSGLGPDEATQAAQMAVVAAKTIFRDAGPSAGDARAVAESATVLLPYVEPGEHGETDMPVCLQHITLGPAEIVTLSGEVFFGIGCDIRRRTGRKDVWVAAYCNGSFGYVPTDQAMIEGGYEPDSSNYYYGRPALQPGSAELLAGAAAGLVKT